MHNFPSFLSVQNLDRLVLDFTTRKNVILRRDDITEDL